MKQEEIKKIVEDKKMAFNGVEIPLTDEQLKKFENSVEKT